MLASKRIIRGLLVLGFTILLSITASPKAEPISYSASQSFFLPNERGTYTFVEVNLPEGEGPFPIVFLSHGFAGSIHSGGAMELSNRLADEGIIAIRCDWNPYVKDDKKSERVGSYSLRDMEEDYRSVMEYAFLNYNVDVSRIGAYGRSYGGRFAMTCANESVGGYNIKALALVAPAGDDICFTRFLGGKDKYEELKMAASNGQKAEHLDVKLTKEWFYDVESYNPSAEGEKFGDNPVILIYNTLDKVVYPDTSLRCADAYRNCKTIEITSEDGHGHEMGFEKSHTKDMIMDNIVKFFAKNL